MSDLISRQAAIDAIWEVRITPGGELFNAIKRAQEELIKQLPSAEPERKRGKWIKPTRVPDSMLEECSVCGFDCGAYTFNYCPNCSADMRGET